MKNIFKIVFGIIAVLVMLSSCNRYIVCPAYADIPAEVEKSNDIPA